MTNSEVVTLREYIERLMGESDRRYEQRFAAQETALRTALSGLNEYKAASNEWRGALKDQSSQMATRSELTKLDELVQELRRSKANQDGRQMVVSVVISSIVGLIVALLSRWMTVAS